MLSIYLNDHLAGATGGVELARRAASAQRDSTHGPELARLATEIAEDRESLLEVMEALDVTVQHYKVGAGWLLEKVGRLKPNGAWVSRAPLSSLVELEGLLLGVTGKGALWRTLRVEAESDPRLDPAELDRLLVRADDQWERIEAMRLQTGVEVLSQAG
jgi:hypothetical protein